MANEVVYSSKMDNSYLSFPKISLLKVESVESAVGNVLRNGKATC